MNESGSWFQGFAGERVGGSRYSTQQAQTRHLFQGKALQNEVDPPPLALKNDYGLSTKYRIIGTLSNDVRVFH